MTEKLVCGAVVAALALGGFGLAQAQNGPPPMPAPLIDYHPTMSDLMTAYVQPRHIKLGLAAKQRNWTYAAYEAFELRGAFNRIQRGVPVFEDHNMGELIASTVTPPLTMAIAAARAGDAKAFDAAYSEMTKSCNLCHDQFKKAYMVIKEPTGNQFIDQEFGPVKK